MSATNNIERYVIYLQKGKAREYRIIALERGHRNLQQAIREMLEAWADGAASPGKTMRENELVAGTYPRTRSRRCNRTKKAKVAHLGVGIEPLSICLPEGKTREYRIIALRRGCRSLQQALREMLEAWAVRNEDLEEKKRRNERVDGANK